jgi:hypothetical protein
VGQFTADLFTLVGPASSNPVTFQAVLHVSGTAHPGCSVYCDPFYGCSTTCADGAVYASFQEGSQTAVAPSSPSINTNLVLSLSKNAGEQFRLDVYLRAVAACNAGTVESYALSFIVPPGYIVTSCYGFVMPLPVAAEQTSWGRLKVLYR